MVKELLIKSWIKHRMKQSVTQCQVIYDSIGSQHCLYLVVGRICGRGWVMTCVGHML